MMALSKAGLVVRNGGYRATEAGKKLVAEIDGKAVTP